jgi:hypothetical protein
MTTPFNTVFVQNLIKKVEKTYNYTFNLPESIIDEINHICPITSGCYFAEWLNYRLYSYYLTKFIDNGEEGHPKPLVYWEDLEETEDETEDENEDEEYSEEWSLKENQRCWGDLIDLKYFDITSKQKQILLNIAKEVDWIDIKPYSHNIVGMELSFLEKEGFDSEKIKSVVRLFGLDSKGWGYLLVSS